MAGRNNRPVKYINDIPFKKRREICQDLDIGKWIDLAAELNFSPNRIKRLSMLLQQPNGSPTDELLTEWGHSNATVLQLFKLLKKLKMISLMDKIKEYVSKDEYFNAMRDLGLPLDEDEDEVADRVTQHVRQDRSTVQKPQSHSTRMPSYPPQAGDYSNVCVKPKKDIRHPIKPNVASQFPNPTSCHNLGPGIPMESVDTYTKDIYNANTRKMLVNSDKSSLSGNGSYMGSDPPSIPRRVESLPAGVQNPHLRNQACYDSSLDSNSSLATLKKFDYKDIIGSTYGFHKDLLIGEGGFGEVYKAVLAKTNFAIKLLRKKYVATSEDPNPLGEIEALVKYKHENIVQLIGYAEENDKLCLVYQFMANGSLEDRLACKNHTPPLPWYVRHNILTGAARGLQYLHSVSEKPLIHGDVASSNILLDKHMEAKLCDFGLAREATGGSVTGQYTHVTKKEGKKVYGRKQYLPHDFFEEGCKLSVHVDKYSFGIVFFETCTGLPSYDELREGGHALVRYIKNGYKRLGSQVADDIRQQKLLTFRDENCSNWDPIAWLQLMELGKQLTSEHKCDRPDLTKVLEQLEKLQHDIMLLLRKDNTPGLVSPGSISQPGSIFVDHLSWMSQGQGRSLHTQNPQLFQGYNPQLVRPYEGIEMCQTKPNLPRQQQFACSMEHQMANLKIQANYGKHHEDIVEENSKAVSDKKCDVDEKSFHVEKDLDLQEGDNDPDNPKWLAYDKAKLGEVYEKSEPRSYKESIPYQLQVEHDKKKQQELNNESIVKQQEVKSESAVKVQKPFDIDEHIPHAFKSQRSPSHNEHLYENLRSGVKPNEKSGNAFSLDNLDQAIPLCVTNQATGPIYQNIEDGEVCLLKAPMKQDTEILQNEANMAKQSYTLVPPSYGPHMFVPVHSNSPVLNDDEFEIASEELYSPGLSDARVSGAHINPRRQYGLDSTPSDFGLDSDSTIYDDVTYSREGSRCSDTVDGRNRHSSIRSISSSFESDPIQYANVPITSKPFVENPPPSGFDSLETLKNKGLPPFMFQEEESELLEFNKPKDEQPCASGITASLENLHAVRVCDRFKTEGEHQHFQHVMSISPQLYDEIQQQQHDLELATQRPNPPGPQTPTRSTPSTPTYALPIYSQQSRPSQVVYDHASRCNSTP